VPPGIYQKRNIPITDRKNKVQQSKIYRNKQGNKKERKTKNQTMSIYYSVTMWYTCLTSACGMDHKYMGEY
jgi:hypothetical protein